MPNRILREGIITSPKLAKLGWGDEVFYRRLMSVVDDFGRYFADVGLLRGHLYPRQLNKVSDSDVGKWLGAVQAADLVRVYPAQDGERYLEIVNFGQQVRAQKSKYPNPPASDIDCKQLLADEHLDVFGDVSVVGDEVAAVPAPPSPVASDRCPQTQIVEAFKRLCPQARHPAQWNASRAALLRARWDEDKARQSLGWWERFFAYVARSGFLMGTRSSPGRRPFELGLEWLLKSENFLETVEGKFHEPDEVDPK